MNDEYEEKQPPIYGIGKSFLYPTVALLANEIKESTKS